MIDEPDEMKDERIAQHIADVHRKMLETEEDDDEGGDSVDIAPPYTTSQMQLYIKYIRTIKPKLTPQVRQCLLLFFHGSVVDRRFS